MNKVNVSSLRVLQMLQLLFEKSRTMSELMEEMSIISGEPCSNFLVCKYINTCRFCGINIQKINSKYTLLKLPFDISFSDDELDILEEIEKLCSGMRVSKTVRNINNIIDKLNKRTDKYHFKIDVPETDRNIKAFERSIDEGRKIKLKYKEGGKKSSITCEPLELSYEGDKLAIVINHNGDKKKILYTDVKEIISSPLKALNSFASNSVIFRMKNILARRYTMRPDEKLVDYDELDGTISILNRTEDKKSLLNRLLKYGDLCEIISPRSLRKEMLSIINETLANYK